MPEIAVFNLLRRRRKRFNLLKEIFLDGQQSYYDSNTSNHHHIYNIDTGDLSDIPCIFNNDQLARIDSSQLSLPEGTQLEEIDVVIKVSNSPG